eukprot:7193555-Lingulodinium_polyedra.AAC.1
MWARPSWSASLSFARPGIAVCSVFAASMSGARPIRGDGAMSAQKRAVPNKDVRVGYVFGICVENAEMDAVAR